MNLNFPTSNKSYPDRRSQREAPVPTAEAGTSQTSVPEIRPIAIPERHCEYFQGGLGI
jgi:hypothetical protein